MSTNIYRIDGPWPGRLAISARPRGGDWLEDEVKGWRQAGFDIIVSLLTPDEADEMDLKMEERYSRQHQMEFVSFPIVDRSVPESRVGGLKLIERLEGVFGARKEYQRPLPAGHRPVFPDRRRPLDRERRIVP